MITNEALERLVPPLQTSTARPKPAGSPTAAADEEAPVDFLKALEEEKQKAVERKARIANAETQVSEAQASVKSLEALLLAQKNPLLPRQAVPRDEMAAVQGLDSAQRVQRTQQQIDEARMKLRQAQADLALRSGN